MAVGVAQGFADAIWGLEEVAEAKDDDDNADDEGGGSGSVTNVGHVFAARVWINLVLKSAPKQARPVLWLSPEPRRRVPQTGLSVLLLRGGGGCFSVSEMGLKSEKGGKW